MKCCICGCKIYNHGNNAEPVLSGRCCDECNMVKIIPMRIKQLKNKK